ncbi:MAG: hypothetical protein HC830_08715 [Bacteroidetes bacterium]|nr:hypothetical protein [Bacteroidota bacterium]
MFDPNILPKKVNLDSETDMVATSAVNFYDGVTEQEAVNFYEAMKNPNDEQPLSYGINSKLAKEMANLLNLFTRKTDFTDQLSEKL